MNSEGVVSLGYAGYITANIIKDNIKISMHNRGTQALGTFLTKALVCNFNAENIDKKEAPLFVDIYSGDESILKHPVYLTGGTYGEATGVLPSGGTTVIGACKFTTVIQAQDLKTSDKDTELFIKLCNNTAKKDVLATIPDNTAGDLKIIVTALKSQDVVIEWVMLIINPS